MLFNSWAFLFAFLPLTLAGFHLCARASDYRLALGWLTASSFVFYAAWNPPFLALLLGSIAVNHRIGVALTRRRSVGLLTLGVTANLTAIGVFKYAGLFAETLAALGATGLPGIELLLPLGISFFTFQQIGWLVDIKRGRAQARSLLEHALYVAFFPQLIAGPILQQHEVIPQFRRSEMGARTAHNLAVGLAFLAIGLFKKVVLADSVAGFASPVFASADAGIAPAFAEAWLAAIAFSLQLYFDFSGYSDMAIGLARLFGVVLPANFDSPYRATNIIDFWRRWHMTLSRFLRDYLYIPLGGNRHGTLRTRTNLMVTMLLGALWHGAGWTFVLWGALHGGYLLINHGWRRLSGGSDPNRHRAWAHALTLLAVIVAWVPFRADTLAGAGRLLGAMIGLHGIAVPGALAPLADAVNRVLGQSWLLAIGPFPNRPFDPTAAIAWLTALAALALLAPNSQQWLRAHAPVLGPVAVPVGLRARLVWQPSPFGAFSVGTLLLLGLWQLPGTSAFLYFRF